MDELLAGATWHSAVWLLIAGLISLGGSLLALRGRASGKPARLVVAPSAWALASWWRAVPLALTSAAVFLACFEVFYQHLGLHFPIVSVAEGWTLQAIAAAFATLIAARGTRNIRNVALSGALLSGGTSCMLFIIMSGLAAPAPLGYDLRGIVIAMAASGTLAAIGFWLAGGYWQDEIQAGWKQHLTAGAFIAASLILVCGGSLASILTFSDWSLQIETPHGFAFQPIVVVFVSESAVTAVLGLIGAAIDHRAASLIDRENERLRELAESTFEALVIHRGGIVLDANQVFCSLVGKRLVAVKGERFATFLSEVAELTQDETLAPADLPGGEYQIIAAEGHRLPVEVLSRAIAFAGGPAVVTALRDISERQAAEAKIRFLAHHDVLTGLPNRSQLHDVIASHLIQSKQSAQSVAVLCLDLDRFKTVNDTFGHQAGDRLLRQVAERLLDCLRPVDAAARIGGDEFILLVSGITRPDSVATLARRLIDTLSQPFDLGEFEARIGASIGIAVGPRHGTTAEVLIKNADIALYKAKANGRGGFCFFESGMDQVQQERRALEQDLREAVADEAFELVFQPQFAAVTRKVVSFEALVRWKHAARGDVPPAEFIPLAEATGLIVILGRWVLQAACLAARSWATPCVVAVNVSPRQFIGDDFADTVEAVLRETGLPADRLELEITESVMIHEAERALRSLVRLKSLGVRLALDDFGTGFSSLSNLQRFPFDKVKIDKSFIHDLIEQESARAIVGAILAMSHQLNLVVTAEGVETEAQLVLLQQQNCDLIQGYLLSRPIPMDAVPAFLATHSGNPQVVRRLSTRSSPDAVMSS